jgi:hypothetical protein
VKDQGQSPKHEVEEKAFVNTVMDSLTRLSSGIVQNTVNI